MDKGRIRYRYEQRRGHYLVAEGAIDQPLAREDCDKFQLRMLISCEVPGLLRPEIEEIDGRLSLRYALSGARMLAQVVRTKKWSMSVYMSALCRLAEVMEDCRLYVLNPDQILLEDDLIFIGDAGVQDLRFVYLPIPIDQGSSVSGMESLAIRWMMHVTDPDGTTIQQVLRLIASPGFKPADLSKFARQYSASSVEGLSNLPEAVEPADQGELSEAISSRDHGIASKEKPQPTDTSGWRWFQPVSSDAHAMSAWLGDEQDAYGEAPEAPPAPSPYVERKKVWLLCAAIGVIAAAWRLGYASSPSVAGLSLSTGITIAVLAGAGWQWLKFRRTDQPAEPSHRQIDEFPERQNEVRSVSRFPPNEEIAVKSEQGGNLQFEKATGDAADSAMKNALHSSAVEGAMKHAPYSAAEGAMKHTLYGRAVNVSMKIPICSGIAGSESESMLGEGEEDRTQYLDSQPPKKESQTYYLTWESDPNAPPIPLTGPSLVIGRSREASGHLDVSPGISRAHLELLRTGEGWTATDLGSRNGSKLNGSAMVAYEPYPLHPDDSLELAGSVYRLKYGGLNDASINLAR